MISYTRRNEKTNQPATPVSAAHAGLGHTGFVLADHRLKAKTAMRAEPVIQRHEPLEGFPPNPLAATYPLGHPLFNADNLEFITQTEHRKPTLYFGGDGKTGRMRQEHNEGALAEEDRGPAERKFFPTKYARKIHHAVGFLKYGIVKKKQAKNPPAAAMIEHPPVFNPTDGHYVSEEVPGMTPHFSEGRVSTDTGAYSERDIAHIHQEVVLNQEIYALRKELNLLNK